MQLLRPKKWTQKPPLGTKINYGNPITKGLRGVWMFQEGAGTSVFDASGNNNTGTLGTSVSRSAGKQGKGLSFPGTNDDTNMVTVANSPSIDIVGTVTMACWAYPKISNNYQTLIDRCGTGGGNRQYAMYFSTEGVTNIFVAIGGFNIGALAVTPNWVVNKWNHIVVTADGTNVKIYVNGVLANTTASTNILSSQILGLYMGREFGNAFPLNGLMDSAMIWARAITYAEVRQLYTDPYGIFVPQSPTYRNWFSTAAVGIAFDAAANSGYQAAQSTYTFNRTCTGSNRYLVVDVSLLSAGQTVTSIVDDNGGGNVQMTFIGARSTVSSVGRIETWGLVAPATGTKSIQVNLSGTIASAATAVSYTGVHQTLPYEAFNSNQATNVGAADATVVVTPIANNTWIHAAIATDDGSITANQTTRNNVTGAGGSGANEDTGPITPAAATTMSYTNVGALQTWAIAGVALRPIAASGPVSGNFSTNQLFQLLGLGT